MTSGSRSLPAAFQRLGNLLPRNGLHSLFSSNYTLSVAAQAFVSGFHFLLNLVLLRTISQHDYGIFAFAFVLGMFAQAINNALVSTPLTVYTPIISDQHKRQSQESMLSLANLLFTAALVTVGLVYLPFSGSPWQTGLGVTLFVCVYSARHFSRSFGYSRLRPLVTASGDLCYVFCGTVFTALILWQLQEPGVGLILTGLAAANLCAIALERTRLHGLAVWRIDFRLLADYREIWSQSRWALVGALTTLLLGQAHSLIVTGSAGPGAFAPLAAGFVLFGPVRVALLTWQNMVKPEIAIALSDHKTGRVLRQVRQTSLLMGLAVLAIALLMYLLWPFIHDFLYAKKYADEPMGRIVAIWAVVTFFAAIYNAPSAALQAMRDFRILAMASLYGAAISLLLVGLLLWRFTPAATLYGVLLAECFMAVFLGVVMYKKLRDFA